MFMISSSSNLLVYLSARVDQISSNRIVEAVLSWCSGQDEEGGGVESEKELEDGVDANRRLLGGGTSSLKVRRGEDAKYWEREESVGESLEVEALGLIARAEQVGTCRADHMSPENAC